MHWRCSDGETGKRGGMEVWMLDVGVATWRYGGMELWSYRGALQECRRKDKALEL